MCYFCTYACQQIHGRHTITRGHAARSQRTLWYQFYFQLAAQQLAFKFCILTYIRRYHLRYLPALQQQAYTKIIYAGIVGNTCQSIHFLFYQCGNTIFRDAAQAKTA